MLIMSAIILAYVLAAIHVLRRLAWHFAQGTKRYNRDGRYIGAFCLSLALPVGVIVMLWLDRNLAREGRADFMLPPKPIRKERRIQLLEEQNANYERRLGIR